MLVPAPARPLTVVAVRDANGLEIIP